MQAESKYPLTIITINLNNRDGLEKTIESVVNQTYRDFEYIVIDGASTDGSVDIIQHYADKISYWVSEPDTGIYNAMNKGIRVAQGEYLLFLNSGDWLVSNKIINIIIAVSKKNIDIIYGNLIIQTIEGLSYEKKFPQKIYCSYLIKHYLPHPASFIRKELFFQISFYDEKLKICADWKFFLEAICFYNAKHMYVNEIISNFTEGGISYSLNHHRKLEKNKILKEKFGIFFDIFFVMNKLIKKIKCNKEN